eukprot:758437-Hanusia_phi.AAC.1
MIHCKIQEIAEVLLSSPLPSPPRPLFFPTPNSGAPLCSPLLPPTTLSPPRRASLMSAGQAEASLFPPIRID